LIVLLCCVLCQSRIQIPFTEQTGKWYSVARHLLIHLVTAGSQPTATSGTTSGTTSGQTVGQMSNASMLNNELVPTRVMCEAERDEAKRGAHDDISNEVSL
jgi:hypothetical protein